jgi:dipeptidyl aminopeptidase/acylaminoacyl peptidase
MSDGLKIYGLLSVPDTPKPTGGYPAIIFNHGYIPPEEYKTTERYVAYFAGFASNGYVVFKPDYRGNGDSQGQPTGAYYSTGYTTDVLNALSSVAKMKEVNPQKIGMWGHSMGGYLTLQALVIKPGEIKAAVIWGGVVETPEDLLTKWHPNQTFHPSQREINSGRTTRQTLIKQYGTPSSNPTFWNAISAYSYLQDITAPVQLDHGLSDEEVPMLFSQNLYNALTKDKKNVELYTYPGNDHNLSQSFDLAMERSVSFFDKYLK